MTLSYIPADTNAEGILKAVASGTLPNGKPVIVNADGTVSVAVVIPSGGGTPVDYAAEANLTAAAFDSNSGKVVIMFSYYSVPKYIVGTVSGSTITFGTAASFKTGNNNFGQQAVVFDSNSNKVVFVYKDLNNSNYGTAIVGTVSGTTINFGSEVVFESGNARYASATFDSNLNKVVIAYQTFSNDYGNAIVGTVSGTSISFGNKNTFAQKTFFISCTFDSNSNKVVIAYRNFSSSSYGTAIVGTVSGTAISFGTAVVFESASTAYTSCAFDSSSNKVVIAYQDAGNSTYGTAIVGTVSGTNISFGTAVVFESAEAQFTAISFDTENSKVVISYRDTGNSGYATAVVGTVSGTGISFNTPVLLESASGSGFTSTYDSTNGKVVIAYFEVTSGTVGSSVVFQSAVGSTLTAENYIGMSSGVVEFDIGTTAIGTQAAFDTGNVSFPKATFDSNSNKVVIAYRDQDNSNYGTAVVGTVNPADNSITFGTPAVFESANTDNISTTFDSNSNKIVIAYRDVGNSNYGTTVIGTVSGTNITFGTAVVFESAAVLYTSCTFDSTNNKVVVSYRDSGNSNYGTSIVGTVSGTNISFGTPAVFESAAVIVASSSYNLAGQKTIIAYQDEGNSDYGTVIAATVSGTNISFGTAVVFATAGVGENAKLAYDSTNEKTVVAYRANVSGIAARAVVLSLSGTSITVNTPVAYYDASALAISLSYDSNANKIVATYSEASGSAYVIAGTVSGTTISFGSATKFEESRANPVTSTFDSNANKVVLAFIPNTNPAAGEAIVYQAGFDNTIRGQVASGSQAITNIIGSVSSIQTGLTAGQSYFVQTDGTIGLTAASPSVFAGTAISATKLIVKT